MYLCEEYMRRHSLDGFFAKQVPSGCVFFKTDDFTQWKLLKIKWIPPTYHPGHYDIRTHTPIHDGHRDGLMWRESSYREVFLEEYEDYFFKWKDSICDVAKGNREIKLAAWEIYLYCYDSLLFRVAQREEILQSIDISLPTTKRVLALEKIIENLYNEYESLVYAWHNDINRYLKSYSHWLANIVRKNA